MIKFLLVLILVLSTVLVAEASCLKLQFSETYSIQDNISSSFTTRHSESINSAGVFVGPIATMCDGYVGLGGFNFNVNENNQFAPGFTALSFFNNIIQVGVSSISSTNDYSMFVGISATELVKKLK